MEDDEERDLLKSKSGGHMSAVREIIAIAKKPDDCIEFPLSKKLSEALPPNTDVALTIAGFIILASAQIYVRKVDYLSQDTFETAQNFKSLLQKKDESQNETESKGNQPSKRTRTKKFNIKANSEFCEVEFRERPVKPAKDDDIFDIMKRPDAKNKVQALKEFFDKHRATASKKTKLILPKRFALSSDNECVAMIGKIQQNANAVREDHFYDYDGEEIVGSRKDFAVYSYIIDSATGELMYDHNFKRFLYPLTQMEQESISFSQMPDIVRMANEDNDDRRDSCNFDMQPQLNSTEINEDQATFNIQDLSSINIPTLDPIDTSADTNETLIPSFSHSLLTDEDLSIYPELTEDEIENLNKQETTVSLIDVKSCTSTKILSDIQLNDVINLNSLSGSILTVDKRILKRQSEFSLPNEYFSTRMENILGIPIKNITKCKIFDLPEEYDYLKKRKKDQGKSTCDVEIKVPKIITEFMDTTPEPLIEDMPAKENFTESDENILPSDHNITDTFADTYNGRKSLAGENITCEDSGIEENGETPNVTPLDSEISDIDDGFCGSQQIIYEKTDTQKQQIENMQKLAEKVNSWHEYLKPILRKSFERSDFQVKEYGAKIIQKISDNDGRLNFSDTIVPGELARYFIATLDLINKNNVGINFEKEKDQPTKLENIELSLLTTELHQTKIDTISEQIENNRKRALLRATELEPPMKKVMTSTPINKIEKSKLYQISIDQPQKDRIMNRCTSIGTDSVYSSQSSGYYSQESVFSSQMSLHSYQEQQSEYFGSVNSSNEHIDISDNNVVPANKFMPSISTIPNFQYQLLKR